MQRIKSDTNDTFLKDNFCENGTPSPTRTDMNRSSTDFESVPSLCKSM